jgi:CheY-like chemotaxis protein
MRVLLVEDNDMNRDMLTRRLTKRGFEVLTAADGAEAVRAGRTQLPDVILMDINLPVIDGWEAIRLLKAGEDTRDIPIIALTAHALAADQEQAYEGGCCDFITKPIDFARLVESIERHGRK